jgi:hypothetical protein
MAPKKAPSLASAFQGRWRIETMDLWDRDAIDLVEPGFVAFNGEQGQMRFIALRAWLDVRYETRGKLPVAAWEGVDEGDQRSGRGSAVLKSDGSLAGHIFFHNGDDSGFTCRRR